MKREYIIPATRWIDMEICGLLAKSFPVDDQNPQGASNSLGRSFDFGEDEGQEDEY